MVVDSRGQEVQELEKEPAQAGSDLTLTIDLALQQRAAELFEERGEARGEPAAGEEPQSLVGSVVALDPRNGDVLAMFSAPAYDPNIFTRRLNRQEWQDLIENPFHPLQNRTIQNAFPPGSVFKIITALTALEKGVVDPNFTVFCPGYSIIYGNRFRCHKQGGHGTMNLRSAFMNSCNVYFHALGQRLQIDTLAEYGPPLRLRPAQRHRPRRRAGGPGARHPLGQGAAQDALVPRRDHLGGHRPGPDPHHPDADRGDDGGGRQRRLPGRAAALPRPPEPRAGARAVGHPSGEPGPGAATPCGRWSTTAAPVAPPRCPASTSPARPAPPR